MAVSFVAAGTFVSALNGGSLSTPPPAGVVANDLLLIQTAPSGLSVPGWTNALVGLGLWWKRAGASEGAATIALNPGSIAGGQMFAYRGALTTGTPIVLGARATASPAGAVATASADEMVFFAYCAVLFGNGTDAPYPLIVATAPGLSSFTKRGDGSIIRSIGEGDSNIYTHSHWNGLKSPAGSTGNISWTPANTAESCAIGRILPATTPIGGRAFNRGFNEGFNGGFN